MLNKISRTLFLQIAVISSLHALPNDVVFCNHGLSADLLYWRTFRDGGCCGSSNESDKWNVGYRLGMKSAIDPMWDFELSWIHFQTGSGRCSKLHYDTLDVEMGNCLCITPCAFLRPSFGLRFAQINQHGCSRVTNEQTCSLGNSLLTTLSDTDERFRGFGPQFNLTGSWDLSCGFSFFAGAGASVLYGRSETKLFRAEIFDDPAEICQCENRNKKGSSVTAVDATLGIQWSRCICENSVLSLKLAWEHHRYLRLPDGDLSFDGASLSTKISF